jgi:hypothetical protein
MKVGVADILLFSNVIQQIHLYKLLSHTFPNLSNMSRLGDEKYNYYFV